MDSVLFSSWILHRTAITTAIAICITNDKSIRNIQKKARISREMAPRNFYPRRNRWNRTHPIRSGRVWSLRKLSIPSGTTRITEEDAKYVNKGSGGAYIVNGCEATRRIRRGSANRRPLSASARPRGRTSPNEGSSRIASTVDGTGHASRMRARSVAPGHIQRRDCGKQPE